MYSLTISHSKISSLFLYPLKHHHQAYIFRITIITDTTQSFSQRQSQSPYQDGFNNALPTRRNEQNPFPQRPQTTRQELRTMLWLKPQIVCRPQGIAHVNPFGLQTTSNYAIRRCSSRSLQVSNSIASPPIPSERHPRIIRLRTYSRACDAIQPRLRLRRSIRLCK